ncbi:MAG: hypothetical protein ACFFAS_09950 [Promethearchaeota archaeon]
MLRKTKSSKKQYYININLDFWKNIPEKYPIKTNNPFYIKYQAEITIFLSYFFYLLVLRIIIPFYQVYQNSYLDWDMYIMMSNDIFSIFKRQIVAPFCYRPLIPFLAGILPFDLQTSYAIIIFVSAYLMGILLYFTLRLKFNKKLSLIGFLLFNFLSFIPEASLISEGSIQLGFINAAFCFVYFVDLPAGLFIMACMYCIFSDRKKAYLIVLVLGALTKEIVLGTIPVFLAYEIIRNEDTIKIKTIIKELKENLKYIVPGILAYMILRIIVIPIPVSKTSWYYAYGGNDYGTWGMFLHFLNIRINEILNEGALYTWLIGVWSPLIIAFCCFNNKKSAYRWISVHGVFILMCYFQIFLGYATARYIQFSFYSFIFLAISGLNNTFYVNPLGLHYQYDSQRY